MKRGLTDAQKSGVLYRLIAERWPDGREYTTLYEARAGVGYDQGADRSIDVLIGSHWKASGRRLIALEVKASRSDWLRELRDHAKRKRADVACGERWVIAWGGCVQPEELPDGWGLMERRGSRLVTMRAAVPRDVPEVPLTFVLSIMRNARHGRSAPPSADVALFRWAGEELTPEQLASVVEERTKLERERLASERAAAIAEAKRLRESRSRVEAAIRDAGVDVHWRDGDFDVDELAEALRLAGGGVNRGQLAQLREAHRLLDALLTDFTSTADAEPGVGPLLGETDLRARSSRGLGA